MTRTQAQAPISRSSSAGYTTTASVSSRTFLSPRENMLNILTNPSKSDRPGLGSRRSRTLGLRGRDDPQRTCFPVRSVVPVKAVALVCGRRSEHPRHRPLHLSRHDADQPCAVRPGGRARFGPDDCSGIAGPVGVDASCALAFPLGWGLSWGLRAATGPGSVVALGTNGRMIDFRFTTQC
jgi:hypothetical protein